MTTERVTASGTQSGRRSRRQRSTARNSTLVAVLAGLLGLSIFLLVVGAITLGGRVTTLTNTNRALTEELFRHEQEIRQLRPRLEASERELQMLMEGRLPNLHSLIPDQVIQVQEQYIKNIVFTVVNQGEDNIYEYKLVMDNTAQLRIQPRFRVMVFDRMGVQVGVDDVELADALGAGESRSHASTLDVFMNSQPRYFAIDFNFNGRARANGDQ
ncbi:MAG: hypothetical protein LC646_12025 [Xanthomonadaceae bacterium]|nr:hypothetical protein [Xanthomonadaceae bacterium]